MAIARTCCSGWSSLWRTVNTGRRLRQSSCVLRAYATRAGEKIRHHNLQATTIQVFMNTNPTNNDPKYSAARTVEIESTADSSALIGTSMRVAQALWRHGFRHQTAGVALVDLYRLTDLPSPIFPSRAPINQRS